MCTRHSLSLLSLNDRPEVRATFQASPVEAFRRHVRVAPYYEEDARALVDLIGIGNVMLGSDYPHAEGLPEPLAYLEDLEGFDDAELRLVMRENGRKLVQPQLP